MAKAYGIESNNPKEMCIKLIQANGIRNFRMGINKVFLKQEDLDMIEREQTNCMDDLNNNRISAHNKPPHGNMSPEFHRADMASKTTPYLRPKAEAQMGKKMQEKDKPQPELM